MDVMTTDVERATAARSTGRPDEVTQLVDLLAQQLRPALVAAVRPLLPGPTQHPVPVDRIIREAAGVYAGVQGVPHLARYMAGLTEFQAAISHAVELAREAA